MVGGVPFDVVIPAGSESELAKIIEKRGEGLDSICFATDDVGELKRQLESKGIGFSFEADYQDHTIAFVHPRDACGVKLELWMALPLRNHRGIASFSS